jgi:hypothetical protein
MLYSRGKSNRLGDNFHKSRMNESHGSEERLSHGKPEEGNAYRVLVGKLAGRRTLVRP